MEVGIAPMKKRQKNQRQRRTKVRENVRQPWPNSMKYVERSDNTSKHTKVLQQDQFM